MKKTITIIILFVIIAGSIYFYKSQNITEGYVIGVWDKEILVVDSLKGTDSKKMEMNDISKAYKSYGTFYKIPITNRILHTHFKIGQKVKIFWSGEVLQSLPGKVEHTSFIRIISK